MEGGDFAARQGLREGERAVLQRPVGGSRPLRRPASALPSVGRQAHHKVRGEEAVRKCRDLLGAEATAGYGADVLDHIGLGEAGRAGAQPGLGVDERGSHFVPPRWHQDRLLPAHRLLQFHTCRQARRRGLRTANGLGAASG